MDAAKVRAWRSHRQGLDGSLNAATPAEVLERVGWARSVGGVGPYVTLFSRAGIGREQTDAAVAALQIHELPAARGCTYVLPAGDFALGLKVGQAFGLESEMKVARKLGVTDKEIDKLCAAVVKALAAKTLDPEGIRQAVGGAARSLGEEGKKKGLSSTLPISLGRLQSEGEIRRVPVNGRLDQQRYGYTLWHPNPLAAFKLSAGEANFELARRFFSWAGPATAAEFQWFSGLGVKAAKAAIDPLKLVDFEPGSGLMLHAADFDALQSFKPPNSPQYSLVTSIDSIALLRRDIQSMFAVEDRQREIPGETGKGVAGGALKDFSCQVILDRGRVVGVWEYDTATESIVAMTFVDRDKRLEAAIKRTEEYVRTQLGDARVFSLDSPKSRAPKIAALRSAATGGAV